jgi:RecA/RadA recombinase
MANIKDIAKKFNKEFKDDNLMILSDIKPDYTRLSTGALGLDYPLMGGIPLGRLLEFSGQQHSGKTTAACVVLAAYQRAYPDQTCVYIDVEHSLDLRFQAKMTGLDLSKMYYVNPNGQSGQQILDMIIEMQKADDIGCIVLDSLPALIPEVVMANDLTKDSGMRATMAKPLYPFYAEMATLVAAKNNLFISINQVRDDGKTFTGVQKYKEPCGAAPGYYSSIIVRFGTRKFTLGDDMDACGAKNGEGADGFRLHFKVMKNKCGACNRGGGFLTFRYNTGFDWINDLLEIALGFGFIKRLTTVTYSLVNLETGEVYKDEDGNELTGKKADLIAYIKGNVKFQTEYLAMLNRVISNEDKNYGNILDERTNAALDAEQNAIDNQFSIDESAKNGQI